MSLNWEWILLILLITGFGWFSGRYYKRKSTRYTDGKRNKAMDKFRDGGCCH